MRLQIREALNKWLRERIAALRGACPLAYLFDMSRVLRSVRLALHLARSLVQGFLVNANKKCVQRTHFEC